MVESSATKTCPECSEACTLEAQFCWRCGFPVGAVSRAEHDPLLGREIRGGYLVLELIGVGGMGRVYRAQQRALGRTVAIKVIHPHLALEEKSLARFMTEARAMSQLNHPHTVSVMDFGKTEDGQPYLVMEYLRGKTLSQVVASEGLLPIPRLLGVVHQVLLGLGEAHALGIIHRDLKPENIIVEPLRRGNDFVKVVDFGLAKLRADEPGSGITMPGIVCGTPDFMAPEQGRGDPIDGRSDLYAVGVVLFWLLCGRLPFEAGNPTQVVMMHITSPVPDPREIAPRRAIPDAVLTVLYRALAKHPDDRYPDAHSFADAISELLHQPEPNAHRSALQPAGAAPVYLPQQAVACASCERVVPWGRFCLACGAELPSTERKSVPAPSETLPFVGREAELGWLLERFHAGRARLEAVRLIGDNGSGKTRLLHEFQRRNPSLCVVWGRPDPYWAEIPGHTLSELVRDLLGDSCPSLPPNETDATGLVLRELLSGEPCDALEPRARRAAYRDALAWSLTVAGERAGQGVLLIVDDFDRVDGVTQQALGDLVALPGSARGTIVLAHTHLFHGALADASLATESVRVLGGLPNTLATDLLGRALRGRVEVGLQGDVAGAVSPLFLDQAIRFALEGGSALPARVADLVGRRITTLVGANRACVQALAVLGDRVPRAVLAAFVQSQPGNPDDCDSALGPLLHAGIIAREEDDSFSLAHPVFHDVVLLTTPVEARRELHRRAGELYRDLGAPVEVLAQHACASEDTMTALLTLERAAQRASARGDDETATHLLQRGLDLARFEIHRGELDDPLSAVVIFGRKLGERLQARGRLSDARGVLMEVLDSTSPRGAERVEVLMQLAEVAQRSNQLAEAERMLERALAAAQATPTEEGLLLGLELRLNSVRSLAARATT